MKIIHVREIANVASTLVDGLRCLGHEAELEPMRGRRSEGALEVTGIPARLLEARRINGYIRRRQFDVVHLHWAYMGWMGILGRYPYFLHCHGSDLRRNLRWPVLGRLTRSALKRAARVFYSTPDLAPLLSPLRPDAVFIPNPINLDRFQPLSARNGRDARILMMSRLDEKKGIETAAAIVDEARRHNPAIQVDAFEWGTLKSRPLGDGFNLIRRVPFGQMPALLGGYDILVGQFKLGAIGMSELEAMACGKPVIAYFNYPEVYDEPPPIVSTRDAKDGAAALLRLLEDRQMRKEMGEKGRAWVEAHHGHVEVARLVERHYREALGG